MLTETDVRALLRVNGADRDDVFADAVAARETRFQRRVVVRAVCHLTEQCDTHSGLCPNRSCDKRTDIGYRTRPADVIETAMRVSHDGITNVLCLQAADRPHITNTMAAAMPSVRHQFGGNAEIMLDLATTNPDAYARLRELGATSCILTPDTSDPAALGHESFDARWARLHEVLTLGYKVESRFSVGAPGQSIEAIAADIIACRDAGVHMMSAVPFTRTPGTPVVGARSVDVEQALMVMAVMRLANPGWVIPAIAVRRPGHAKTHARGFEAGANAIAFDATPLRLRALLAAGKRWRVPSASTVTSAIHSAGLIPAASVYVTAIPCPPKCTTPERTSA